MHASNNENCSEPFAGHDRPYRQPLAAMGRKTRAMHAPSSVHYIEGAMAMQA